MTQVIHGTVPYRVYDVPMLVGDNKYWANAEVTIEYTVTRDPSSGGDFADWDVYSYDEIHLYDDFGGNKVTLPIDGEIKRKIFYQLDEESVVQKCIEDALNFA